MHCAGVVTKVKTTFCKRRRGGAHAERARSVVSAAPMTNHFRAHGLILGPAKHDWPNALMLDKGFNHPGKAIRRPPLGGHLRTRPDADPWPGIIRGKAASPSGHRLRFGFPQVQIEAAIQTRGHEDAIRRQPRKQQVRLGGDGGHQLARQAHRQARKTCQSIEFPDAGRGKKGAITLDLTGRPQAGCEINQRVEIPSA